MVLARGSLPSDEPVVHGNCSRLHLIFDYRSLRPEDRVCKDAMFRKLPRGRMTCKGARLIQDLSVLPALSQTQTANSKMLLCYTGKGDTDCLASFDFPVEL